MRCKVNACSYLKNDVLCQERNGHTPMIGVFLDAVLCIEVRCEVTRAHLYVKVYALAPGCNRDVEVLIIADAVHSKRLCTEIQVNQLPSVRPPTHTFRVIDTY